MDALWLSQALLRPVAQTHAVAYNTLYPLCQNEPTNQKNVAENACMDTAHGCKQQQDDASSNGGDRRAVGGQQSTNMLPRQHRLVKSRDIQRVLRLGRYVRSPRINIKHAANPKGGQRFAFVVSTKVSKRATVRNRIRRQLRALVAAQMQSFPRDRDYVIMLSSTKPLPGRPELVQDLTSILMRFSSHQRQDSL